MPERTSTRSGTWVFLAFMYVLVGLAGVLAAAITQNYAFSTWLLAVALWLKPSEVDHD